MRTFFTFGLALVAGITMASLPPEGKYIDFHLKGHDINGQSYSKYPLKFKYAIACPLIDAKMKDYKVKFPQIDRNLFAFMIPCLKFNYKMTKHDTGYAEQEEHIKNFKNWLITCAEENLIDIIDVANSLDLVECRKLAAAELDKKIRTKLRKNVYYLEDIYYLSFRPLSFTKQFLPNLKKRKTTAATQAPNTCTGTPKTSDNFQNASVSWIAWLKSIVFKKQAGVKLSEAKDLVHYKKSPFAHLKLVKQPDSLFQKIKLWIGLILWK